MLWNKIKDKKPLAYKTGLWDGKRSDKVLVCTIEGRLHVAEMYEGRIDGRDFCDFYNEQDYEIVNVEYWTEITPP